MTSTPRANAAPELTKARFATGEDFSDVIGQEGSVDVHRLRFLAFHGVPEEPVTLRGSVWKTLLPLLSQKQSLTAPISDAAGQTASNGGMESAKLIREALDMYQPEDAYFRRPTIRTRMEKVCVQYCAEHPSGLASQDPKLLVYLFGPFIVATRREKDTQKREKELQAPKKEKDLQFKESEQLFSCFMELLERHNAFEVRERNFRRFMSLFRSQLPRLCAHFEDEELDPRKWVMSWHYSLFARQLPLRCLLRLWDSYFAMREGAFELHVYVCLAVLKMFENDLLDKTYPELRAFMQMLPVLDVERLVAQAQNFQSVD